MTAAGAIPQPFFMVREYFSLDHSIMIKTLWQCVGDGGGARESFTPAAGPFLSAQAGQFPKMNIRE